ncbi:heat shock protein beta-3 [Salvelinus fontinalis]|uniref:Heat shock protein beta-3 n=1 Tax=Salvelinus namaycush TaxID=8040 RepID=A0A8U0QHT6_SALNM|nr:heat shock protein beta-3 [Salvelinus namaycush]XP_055774636.1 heat shock protein beta-3 [Salvelinus fontinalis]
MDWEEGRTMEGLSITHWVNSPVRHQALFQGRDLDDCVEDHDLFALPGPAFPDPGVVKPGPGVVRPAPGVVKLEAVCEGTATSQPQRTEPVYQVLLDVSQFRPEDIMIQVFEGWLLIKAQHGARMDEHGFVTRSFTRQYPLPEKLQHAGDLRALLCHDGILVVESKQRTPVRIQHSEEDPY